MDPKECHHNNKKIEILSACVVHNNRYYKKHFFEKKEINNIKIMTFRKICDFNGDMYEGSVENGKPHGCGKKTFKDGRTYDGIWKMGMMDGYGSGTYPDKKVCECGRGRYVKCTCTCECGCGHTVGTNCKCECRCYTDDGSGCQCGAGYSCETPDDCDCECECNWKDGYEYKGQWKDNLMHGEGTMTFSSGQVFVGIWEYGCAIKITRKTYGGYPSTVQDVYVGEMNKGYLHGKGTITYTQPIWSGDGYRKKYEGEWKYGVITGNGKMTYSDESVIEGEWKDGKIVKKV